MKYPRATVGSVLPGRKLARSVGDTDYQGRITVADHINLEVAEALLKLRREVA